MKTTMKIAAVMVVVGAMAGLASAEVLVTMNKAAVTGPGGEDVYDFFLTLGGPADGEFTNARLAVEMDAATIQDPTPSSTTGGSAVLMDTWVNTVFDYHFDTGTTVIYNAYDPVSPPPPYDAPPVALLDWDFYDTYAGDNSAYSPTHIARVLVDSGAAGTADVKVWTTSDPGVPVDFNFVIPEPATMALLGFGGIGVLLRRKRR